MLRPIIVLSAGLVACATGSPLNQSAAPAYRSGVRLADSSPVMPARRLRLEMPTSREMAHSRTPLTARVELCVSAGGETQTVQIRRSSGDHLFDDAVVTDVSRMRYRPADGSDICEQATVTYTP